MECSWQTYFVTPPEVQQHRHAAPPLVQQQVAELKSRPLLSTQTSCTSTSSSTSGCTSTSSSDYNKDNRSQGGEQEQEGPHMDVAQYGLALSSSFCSAEGDIAGFVATDNCE